MDDAAWLQPPPHISATSTPNHTQRHHIGLRLLRLSVQVISTSESVRLSQLMPHRTSTSQPGWAGLGQLPAADLAFHAYGMSVWSLDSGLSGLPLPQQPQQSDHARYQMLHISSLTHSTSHSYDHQFQFCFIPFPMNISYVYGIVYTRLSVCLSV